MHTCFREVDFRGKRERKSLFYELAKSPNRNLIKSGAHCDAYQVGKVGDARDFVDKIVRLRSPIGAAEIHGVRHSGREIAELLLDAMYTNIGRLKDRHVDLSDPLGTAAYEGDQPDTYWFRSLQCYEGPDGEVFLQNPTVSDERKLGFVGRVLRYISKFLPRSGDYFSMVGFDPKVANFAAAEDGKGLPRYFDLFPPRLSLYGGLLAEFPFPATPEDEKLAIWRSFTPEGMTMVLLTSACLACPHLCDQFMALAQRATRDIPRVSEYLTTSPAYRFLHSSYAQRVELILRVENEYEARLMGLVLFSESDKRHEWFGGRISRYDITEEDVASLFALTRYGKLRDINVIRGHLLTMCGCKLVYSGATH